MKKILILGAGLVAKPLVRYLLDCPDFEVEVASRTVSKAEKLIDKHPRGTANTLNLKDESSLKDKVAKSDIVISMVPYSFHPKVAKYCFRQLIIFGNTQTDKYSTHHHTHDTQEQYRYRQISYDLHVSTSFLS